MDDEDDDIFIALLERSRNRQTKSNRSVIQNKSTTTSSDKERSEDFPFKLSYSVNQRSQRPSNEVEAEATILEYVHEHGLKVLDHCKDGKHLYALVDNSESAVIYSFLLSGNKSNEIKPVTITQTALQASSFQETSQHQQHILYLIHQDDTTLLTNTDKTTYSKVINLNTPTFASLFGKAASLSKSPVLLICANDGCVYWRSMKAIGVDEQTSMLMCVLHSPVCSVLRVQVVNKSKVDDDVTKTLKKALMAGCDDDDDGELIGLLVVCNIGECCLMLPTPKQAYEWLPVRFCLPHPVVSCVQSDGQFMYSTGSSVEATMLGIKFNDKLPSISLEKNLTLSSQNIQQLYFDLVKDSSAPQLMGLTPEFDSVNIPLQPSSYVASSKVNTLSNVLQSIKSHSSSMKHLQGQSSKLDQLLIQLNLFASLRQQQLKKKKSKNNPESAAPLVSCQCYFDHSPVHNRLSDLRVVIKNDSKLKFSDQWSVLISMSPEFDLFEREKYDTDTFSFKIENKFYPDTALGYAIPLPSCLESNPLSKFRVHVSLILVVGRDNLAPNIIGNNVNGDIVMEVEIHREICNCLDLLQVVNVSSGGCDSIVSVNKSSALSSDTMADLLDRLKDKKLRKKRKRPIDDKEEKEEITTPRETLSVSLVISNIPDLSVFGNKEMVKLLFQNFTKGDNSPITCCSLNKTKITFHVSQTAHQGKQSFCVRMESYDIELLYAVHSCLWNLLKTKGAKKQLIKDELEKQVTDLKNMLPSLTESSHEKAVFNLCQGMNCLGSCL